MATRMYDALMERGNHEIGNLNSIWANPFVNGAILEENVDNFTLVELTGYDEEGNVKCKQLSDITKQGFLVTTVEEEHLMEGETYVDFYNAKGEIARLHRPKQDLRFETSAFELNAGAAKLVYGQVAHFDPAKKKYIISDSASTHADYDKATNKFEVVGIDTDFGYAFDKQTIRLMAK
ncbi:TPA: phage morphogenesis protein [Clostridium botulinum]|uniref:hypothetical protein n=1 Tax=Clostridium botulinum TaxID=1491 RepID=UPI000773BE55|nr:hypothetical protein [Clostridium botulinum]APR02510.1 hypothetical protein RSJ2_4119 [Clostridium botulinum]AUN01626.1 phage morphogenesis protein [Clostridium botulinum]MBN3359347.1 phage morphogenesis protein [Clostridium botulinum]MBN3367176.1 phage morphogenesis protein [Clostridium botulinum]MBN3371809.1 phage morphogenesis protein [Clostridium botulinum]